MANESGGEGKPSQPYWLIYLGVLLAGLLMLADAAHYAPIQRVPARLAVGLLYSAFALFVGNGKPSGFIGTAIVWTAILISFLV